MTKVNETQKQLGSTEPSIVGNNILYAVLKLNRSVTYTDIVTKEERKVMIQGIAGYIPCFGTIEEAEEASCGGKFQIVEIMPA